MITLGSSPGSPRNIDQTVSAVSKLLISYSSKLLISYSSTENP
jgi:hypothetical protein